MSKNLISPKFDLDAPIGKDEGPNSNPVGIICAANESRFTSGHYSEQLTGYTVGWQDPENIDAILQRLFPEIPIARRFDFKKADNAQAFLSEVDDIRASSAAFKRVEYSGTSAQGKTLNKGLTIRIDHDDEEDLEAAVQLGTSRLMQRILRNDLRRGLTALDSADTNDTATWAAASNPDKDLRDLVKASADATGVFANVVALGELVWHYRLDSYEVPGRQNGGQRASFTPQQLAQYLMVDLVEVVKARYQSTATAKAAVLAARAYAYSAYQGMGKDDPSAVKRFRSSGRGGQRFGVYRKEYEKFTDVSVEHYSNIIVTGLGIQSLDVTQGSDV